MEHFETRITAKVDDLGAQLAELRGKIDHLDGSALDFPSPKRDLLHRRGVVPALVWIYAMLGEQDAAIDQLESWAALSSRWSVQAILRDPRFDALRDHPRFQALLAKSE